MLTIPLGARALGMGGAFGSVPDDVNGLAVNPALLGTLNSRALAMFYSREFAGLSTDCALFGAPTRFGTLAGGFLAMDAGDLELNYRDGSQRTVKAQQDFLWIAGYGLDLTALFKPVRKWKLAVGAVGKRLSSTIAEEASASAVMADAGLFLSLPPARRGYSFRMGVSVRNLGGKLKYVQEGDFLPLTVLGAAGLTWNVRAARLESVTLAFDYPYEIHEKQAVPRVGIESWFSRYLAFRAGASLGKGDSKFHLGSGLRYGSMEIDYAFGCSRYLSDLHRISLDWRF